jgi:hypothetical protein
MGDKDQAISSIKKIYSKENSLTHETIYKEKLEQYQREQLNNAGGNDSVWRTLTHPEMRGSTWMALTVGIFNVLSGISIVTVYAIIIFEKLI